jgi:hypothetical protein
MKAIVPSKRAGSIFFAIYLSLFAVAVLVLLTVSEEKESTRFAAAVFAYGTGLPVFISIALHWLQKRGWLKERVKK